MNRLVAMKNFLVMAGAGAGVTQPQIMQDGIKFFRDLTVLLTIGSVVYAGYKGTERVIIWYNADDNEKKQAAKDVKRTVIGAVLVVGFETLLAFVLSYFMH